MSLLADVNNNREGQSFEELYRVFAPLEEVISILSPYSLAGHRTYRLSALVEQNEAYLAVFDLMDSALHHLAFEQALILFVVGQVDNPEDQTQN